MTKTKNGTASVNFRNESFFVTDFKPYCTFATGSDFMTYESSDLVFSISGIKKIDFSQ